MGGEADMSLILVAIADLAIAVYIGCLLVSLMSPDSTFARRGSAPSDKRGQPCRPDRRRSMRGQRAGRERLLPKPYPGRRSQS